MIKLILNRDIYTANETCGYVAIGDRKWPTIERAWVPDPEGGIGGRDGVSCVPPGEYRLVPHTGDHQKDVWALVNTEFGIYHWPWEVPRGKEAVSRATILIHPANWAAELRGCIAPGLHRAKQQNGRWFVSRSRDAINEMRTLIGKRVDLSLTITGEVPK